LIATYFLVRWQVSTLLSPFPQKAREARIGCARVWDGHRTFAIVTVPPNELVAQVHDRMPAILRP
jgi:putative SOS response-associated peptidase YedK